MRIAVIGAGTVGGTLGRGWSRHGHQVVFGARDPASEKVQSLLRDCGGDAVAVTLNQAAEGADVVVLATPWDAVESALQAVGDLRGKTLVDCTNPIGPQITLIQPPEGCGAEQIARWAPGAHVCKAFNTTGAENMAEPAFGDVRAWMPVCGDHADAKAMVLQLARELGFDAMDAGPLENARLLEPLAILWIRLAFQQGQGRGFAFSLLHR